MTDDMKQNAQNLWIPRRRLAILQAATAGVAILAMVASIVLYFQAVGVAQHRSCEALKAVVIEATPRDRLSAARAFIRHSPELSKC